jgi:metacaspase-1
MKFALLIGINYKEIEESELFGCIDDILSMRDMLVNEMKFKEENITILTDDNEDCDLYPNRQNILNKLTAFVTNKQSDDELWFHYSGHGTIRKDGSGDEKYNLDSVMIPVDYQTNGIILDDEIYAIIKDVNCELFLLFDCCHSGSICDLPWSYSYTDNMIIKENINKNLVENSNIYAISGCTDNQVSIEKYDKFLQKKVGALTNTFLMMLNLNKYNIDIKELFIEICKYLSHIGLAQTPLLSTSNDEIKYIFTSK